MPDPASTALEEHDSGTGTTDFEIAMRLQDESWQIPLLFTPVPWEVSFPPTPSEVPLPPSRPESPAPDLDGSQSGPASPLLRPEPVQRVLSPARGRRTPELINAPRIRWATTRPFLSSPLLGSDDVSRCSTPHSVVVSRDGEQVTSGSPPPPIPSIFERQIRSASSTLAPVTEASDAFSHRSSPPPDVYSVYSIAQAEQLTVQTVRVQDIDIVASRETRSPRFEERLSLDGPSLFEVNPEPPMDSEAEVEKECEKFAREVEDRRREGRSWRGRMRRVWRTVRRCFARGKEGAGDV